MYAETGLLFPCPQDFHHQHHPLEEELLCRLQASTSNLVQTMTISDYDLGGEGDLFNAPKPIIEEPVMELDYMSAVMSMMCNGDNVVCKEASKVVDVDPIQNEQVLIEDFYECKNDPQAMSAIEAAYSDLADVELPTLQIEGENTIYNDNFVVDKDNQWRVSSGSLESLDHFHGGLMSPEFFDVSGMNIEGVLGIRRPYSKGDIQDVVKGHLGHFGGSIVHLPFERLVTIGEERRQKLSRYRKKKTKRNFGRKIKYACRKALADSQPRVRGRFAKTEECELAKPSK